jgi:hypothetical protein
VDPTTENRPPAPPHADEFRYLSTSPYGVRCRHGFGGVLTPDGDADNCG